jgi:hypothetical protein
MRNKQIFDINEKEGTIWQELKLIIVNRFLLLLHQVYSFESDEEGVKSSPEHWQINWIYCEYIPFLWYIISLWNPLVEVENVSEDEYSPWAVEHPGNGLRLLPEKHIEDVWRPDRSASTEHGNNCRQALDTEVANNHTQ